MKIIDKIYNFVVTIQFVLLFLFIIENFNNLDEIPYIINFTEDIQFDVTINLYLVLGTILAIYIAIVVTSIQVVGTGISEEGSRNISKGAGYVVLWLVLSLGLVFYVNYLPYPSLITLMFTIPHILKGGTLLINSEGAM